MSDEVNAAGTTRAAAAPIWRPSEEAVARSAMTAFTRRAEETTGRRFASYADLHRWSVEDGRAFWRLFLETSGLAWEGSAEPVRVGDEVETATFFPTVRLSYAENLLRTEAGGDGDVAIVAMSESGERVALTRAELRERVLRAAGALAAMGVGPGTPIAALARNDANTVVACLAATALGAAWSSVSPDLGTDLVTARFSSLEPSILFAHRESRHQGVRRSLDERIEVLQRALPSVEQVLSLEGTAHAPWEIAGGPLPSFPRFSFAQPLFVLASSGTTGVPKAIVHGAGGTLVEHFKEHRLHADITATDVLLFVTTCGWMMWNWQLSALACGSRVVLYDGSPTHPDPDALWRVVERERVTVLGTSPAYLQYCADSGIVPRERADLSRLRAILSTGSVLRDVQYEWVAHNVKDLPLQSISGGTDILGCFMLGNPNLPVWAGESQCLSLGMDVRVRGDDGADQTGTGVTGELVCANPFPSRPTEFLADPDRRRYHEAYFAQNPGLWTHGDLARITERGTARILGRSDGVMNVRGNRVGPAEIYGVLQGIAEIQDAMAVEQEAPRDPGGTRLVLLVVMRAGTALDRPLQLRIKKELSTRASAAHVPSVIAAVTSLPVTHNGKRSERAARDAVNGRPAANVGALSNPECLQEIARVTRT